MATGPDRATRLADVALCWTVIQHFFPYFDVVHADWDAALREALRSAAVDSSGTDFGQTLERLMAHLEDGHANVSGPGIGASAFDSDSSSFDWNWVEGRLVVTAVDDPARTGLRRGDEVLTVNGEPVERRYARLAPRISAATDGFRRFKSLWMMAESGETVVLEVQGPDGTRRTASFRASRRFPARFPGRPAPIAELRPGIWYVNVARTSDSAFAAKVNVLAAARGVIFDVRGYPRHLGVEPLAHLTDTTLTSAQWYVPIVTAPDHRGMTFDFSNWPVAPLAPRFRGRVAFLIDGRAISYAETWLGIVEHYRLGALVGEPTAGTNGKREHHHAARRILGRFHRHEGPQA
jgi:C-terminal processing protease CtpA/Prc